jgi:uncharacterized membrane protein HdeD (DUF308 family)
VRGATRHHPARVIRAGPVGESIGVLTVDPKEQEPMTTIRTGSYDAGQAFGQPAAAARRTPRWLLAAVGALSILAGFAALLWPGPTLLTVGILFGVYLGVAGAALVIAGIAREDVAGGLRVLDVVMGLAGVFAGMLLIVRPEASVAIAALVLGLWCVMHGVTQLVRAVEPQGRWLNILGGMIGVAAGVIVLASPEIGLGTIVLVVGVMLICHGCLQLMMAFTDLGEEA